MKAQLFKMHCLTNLHVGSGDTNFNIIDNEVERDCVTDYPTVHASGIKGAFREHFEVVDVQDATWIGKVFGQEEKKAVKDSNGNIINPAQPFMQGKLKFLSANMLAIPKRASGGDQPYYMVTTQKAIDAFNTLAKSFEHSELSLDNQNGQAQVEGYTCSLSNGLLGFGINSVAVMSDKEFGKPELPIIARNKLENGKSVNLWFEEVVPHESVFYFFVVANDTDEALLNDFAEKICTTVQIGGNATIGCGLCQISAVGGQAQ